MAGLQEEIIYADEHLLVLDKPAGLLSVPGRGAQKQDCLAARVQRRHPEALVVHRLDMATSGLCLMARSGEVQRLLGLAFAQRQVGKRYVAIVSAPRGASDRVTGEWELIDLPIAADWPNRPRRIIDHERGKPSQTRMRVLEPAPQAPVWGEGCGRVELDPLTGRTHQLRVHLQALGQPILGDTLYAPPEIQARAPRLLLHASRLRFDHPVNGQPLDFSSPAPF